MKRRKFVLIPIFVLGVIIAFVVIAFLSLTSADRNILFGDIKSFEQDGLNRSYRLHTPAKPVTKIIIGLHGFSGSNRQFAYYTGLHNVVDDSTMVVYPNATTTKSPMLKRGWNAGFCCGTGFVNKVDDAGFIVALVGSLKETYNAQDAKVYVTGFSNGAFMSQRLIADYPDVFTAAVSASGAAGTIEKQIKPTKPVPILIAHGAKDTRVNFNGLGNDKEFQWLSHEQTVEIWTVNNGQDAPVQTKVYPDDKHQWHDWRLANFWHSKTQQSIDTVEFFNKY